MSFSIGICIETRVIRLQSISKEDPGCQHILLPSKRKHFELILENKNLLVAIF